MMASAGLYSYDAHVSQSNGHYFLVASPASALHVDQIPHPIRDLLRRTQSSYLFANVAYISATETRNW